MQPIHVANNNQFHQSVCIKCLKDLFLYVRNVKICSSYLNHSSWWFFQYSLLINSGVWKTQQEAQLSPSDRAMHLVSSNLANCHATVQKLLIRQVLTKLMAWSWRFSRRQCVMNNVHSTMTRPSRLPLSQMS